MGGKGLAPIISIKNVSKQHSGSSKLALRNVSLDIEKGQFFGLLGPNGCGKTTLISILTGLTNPTSGKAFIDGKNTQTEQRKIKPLIGLVPQELALYSTLSIIENLKFFGRLYGLSNHVLSARIKRCLRIARLEDCAHRPIKHYSGGMMRCANIVISLVHNPSILFLDEPTINVDPSSRRMIYDLLTYLNTHGTTIIFTTQYLAEAESMCQKIAIMKDGQIVACDTPQALIANTIDAKDLGEVFLKLTRLDTGQ